MTHTTTRASVAAVAAYLTDAGGRTIDDIAAATGASARAVRCLLVNNSGYRGARFGLAGFQKTETVGRPKKVYDLAERCPEVPPPLKAVRAVVPVMRRPDQTVLIGNVRVTVSGVGRDGWVVLTVDAPVGTKVVRAEMEPEDSKGNSNGL